MGRNRKGKTSTPAKAAKGKPVKKAKKVRNNRSRTLKKKEEKRVKREIKEMENPVVEPEEKLVMKATPEGLKLVPQSEFDRTDKRSGAHAMGKKRRNYLDGKRGGYGAWRRMGRG